MPERNKKVSGCRLNRVHPETRAPAERMSDEYEPERCKCERYEADYAVGCCVVGAVTDDEKTSYNGRCRDQSANGSTEACSQESREKTDDDHDNRYYRERINKESERHNRRPFC